MRAARRDVTVAVGLLHEFLAGDVPIAAAVHVKPALAAGHLELPRAAGVRLTDPAAPFSGESALALVEVGRREEGR
ncbi:hypothetical protein [Actinoplanes palleronii]|nr:hypothetical protein [Actinoplanes palleronii]